MGASPNPNLARAYPVTLRGQLLSKMPMYIGGAALLFVQQYLMARRDFLSKDGVDAIAAGNTGGAETAALWILLVSVLAAGVRVASRVTVFTAGRNVEYELRSVLLDRLQQLGPAFFRKMPTGEIMSRATNDLTQVRLLLGFGILNIIGSAFALVSALYVMTSVSLRLTAASVMTMPLLWLTTRAFSIRMFKSTRENQEAIGKMSDRVLASLTGVRVVRAFGLFPSELGAFETSNQSYLDKSLVLARVRGSMGPIMGSISALGVLIVFWYGGHLLATGQITQGDFVSFWLALLRLTWPLLALGFVAAIVQRGRAGYERVLAILEATPDVLDGPITTDARVVGDLSVKHLSFAYGARKVVDDVSFDVPAGSSLALVGRTGSGKSTIATLLPRLLPTPKGTVFLDGDDVNDLSRDRVRGAIAYAQQDAFLFSTTVTRNVGYSLEDADSDAAEAKVRSATRDAAIETEVAGLPDGFDTVVGERGVQLSGGQRQRVALARALLRDVPVLVLDDPLSAVDAKTESAILEAIDRHKAEHTLILITHRVAAAKRCDRIVVLDAGRIVDQGTHAELVSRPGIYATFATEQAIEADLMDIDVPPSSRPPSDAGVAS